MDDMSRRGALAALGAAVCVYHQLPVKRKGRQLVVNATAGTKRCQRAPCGSCHPSEPCPSISTVLSNNPILRFPSIRECGFLCQWTSNVRWALIVSAELRMKTHFRSSLMDLIAARIWIQHSKGLPSPYADRRSHSERSDQKIRS